MAQELRTLVKHFEFTNENRALMTFVGSVRLDPADNFVKLLADSNGQFPTTGDHYVIGPLFQPTAVRQWLAFQAFIDHPKDGTTPLTGDGFRLHDGTNQWYWNGSAWTQSTTLWSTEAEIATNIATFPATARKLRPVVRLTTTDKTKTPHLKLVKVAWKGKIPDFIEDILFRSLAVRMRQFRYLQDFAFDVPFPGGTSLPLSAHLSAAGVPLTVRGADAVFNHSLDPDHIADLLSSFDANTLIATLSTAIPVGSKAFVQLLVEPEAIVMSTSPDFTEVQKVPALLATDIASVESQPLSQSDSVANKSNGDLWRIPAPYRINIRFSMIALAPGAVDLARMIGKLVEFVDNDPFLHSPALDQKFRLWMVEEFNPSGNQASMNELHSSTAQFIIKDILSYKKPAVLEKAIQRVKLRGDMNVDTDNP